MTRKEFLSCEWLLGKKEAPVCDDLLYTQTPNEPQMKVELPKEEEIMEEVKSSSYDQVWTNIEFLKMALEIEASREQKMVFYVDVGNLPKTKAEAYVKEQMAAVNNNGDYWLSRREGGRGTELVIVPGRVTLDGIMETAQKLKDFATK
jgi:hypothetical protein